MSLAIEALSVFYQDTSHGIHALDEVSLAIPAGECLALVGESGSGKTTLGMACMGLLPQNARRTGGIKLKGRHLENLDESSMNEVRWERVAMVFQNGAANLNPVHRVVDQVAEPLIYRRGMSRSIARVEAAGMLASLGLHQELHSRYPHQLSGGQVQRALLAMALILDPDLLILDEPTASLDCLSKGFVAETIHEAKAQRKAVVLITHDLEAAAHLADRIAVLYLGQVLENLPAADLFTRAMHPYTRALVRSFPVMTATRDLGGIRGDAFYRVIHRHAMDEFQPEDHSHLEESDSGHRHGHAPLSGCLFSNRCTQGIPRCREESVALQEAGSHEIRCLRGGIVDALVLKGVSKQYGDVTALQETDLTIKSGEVFSLVGETGSGKTTLAMIAAGVINQDTGERILDQQDMDQWMRRDYKSLARHIGVIYQSPGEAVSPRFSVFEAVAEPLRIQGAIKGKDDLNERVREALAAVRLSTARDFLTRSPHELNMGAIQRICIARALILKPSLLIADEPTSSLDPSVQAKVVKLLLDLQTDFGLSMLFVTHDIGLARKISDRIAVMLAGGFVEVGPAHEVLSHPWHPYTRLLVESAAGSFPAAHGDRARSVHARGCPFVSRCPRHSDVCFDRPPILKESGNRKVACHYREGTQYGSSYRVAIR